MTAALPWIIGALVLIVAGVLATWAARHRPTPAITVDRARSLLSQLDLAIDQAADDVPAKDLTEPRRLQLLAGGCLAHSPNSADARRSSAFSRRALKLLR